MNVEKMPERWVDNRQRKRPFKDLSGNQYGRLLVLYRSSDEVMSNGNKTPRYACQCQCGDISLVRATSLKSGHTSSCKRCNRSQSMMGVGLQDLTGREFGRWTVLERAADAIEPRGKQVTRWLCKCECGVIKTIRSSSLVGGTTQSCGCYKHDTLSVKRNLKDQQFGFWKVIGNHSLVLCSLKSQRWYYAWLCQCKCGSKQIVSEQSLVFEKSTSCGCRTESMMEGYVYEILNYNGISHIRNQRFDALKGVNGGRLSYDFGLYDRNGALRYLIECQGRQHYEAEDYFGGISHLQKQQHHDGLKREYAEGLAIPLVEIHYKNGTSSQIEKILKPIINDINFKV